MPPVALDRETLARLVAEIEGFSIRDRALVRAQAKMRAAIATAGEIDPELARAYLKALRAYFKSFAAEAKSRLADVERRLARTSQEQYNLTAERGVAAERASLTQGVLRRIEELAGR
jgi:hypothetical protein